MVENVKQEIGGHAVEGVLQKLGRNCSSYNDCCPYDGVEPLVTTDGVCWTTANDRAEFNCRQIPAKTQQRLCWCSAAALQWRAS